MTVPYNPYQDPGTAYGGYNPTNPYTYVPPQASPYAQQQANAGAPPSGAPNWWQELQRQAREAAQRAWNASHPGMGVPQNVQNQVAPSVQGYGVPAPVLYNMAPNNPAPTFNAPQYQSPFGAEAPGSATPNYTGVPVGTYNPTYQGGGYYDPGTGTRYTGYAPPNPTSPTNPAFTNPYKPTPDQYGYGYYDPGTGSIFGGNPRATYYNSGQGGGGGNPNYASAPPGYFNQPSGGGGYGGGYGYPSYGGGYAAPKPNVNGWLYGIVNWRIGTGA